MGSRIGRRAAQETYPQSRGVTSVSAALARNFARGPAADTLIAAEIGAPPPQGTQAILWATVGSGTAGLDHITVTPRVTGLLSVTAVVAGYDANPGGTPSASFVAQVAVGGVVTGNPATGTTLAALPGADIRSIMGTISIQTFLGPFPLGVPVNIGVLVAALDVDEVTLSAQNTTLNVQEVPAATG
jgi:hypothetical protein